MNDKERVVLYESISNLVFIMTRKRTGPDHLAALLPRCCGQRWHKAGRIGAVWEMGHDITATLLGLTAFGLKNRISNMFGVKSLLIGASSAMEVTVGASLIFIGLLGIHESILFGADEGEPDEKAVQQEVNAQRRAALFNVILHGFSWDGAPSLALAVEWWRRSISF